MNKKEREKQSIVHIPEDHKVVIDLYKEFAYSKKDGKVEAMTNDKGIHSYQRHDLMGLQEVLYRFNSTLHDPMTDFKSWGKLVRKVNSIILDTDKDDEATLQIGLSVGEAAFLKEYLAKFNEKDGKAGQPLAPSALHALPSILEQLK